MGQLPHYRKHTIPEHAKKVFDGVIFDIYQWEQKLYDGSTATFEKIARPDTVSIFPILEDGTIMLIEDTQPARDTKLRIPMGRVDPGETPEETAERELLEETGLQATELVPFYDFEFYEKADWRIYVYLARRCKKVAEQDEGIGEKIQPHPVAFKELLELAKGDTLDRMEEFSFMVWRAENDPEKMKLLKTRFGV